MAEDAVRPNETVREEAVFLCISLFLCFVFFASADSVFRPKFALNAALRGVKSLHCVICKIGRSRHKLAPRNNNNDHNKQQASKQTTKSAVAELLLLRTPKENRQMCFLFIETWKKGI